MIFFLENYMRKKLLSIIAAVISAFFVFSAFSGCNLLTVDNERDMAQKVATVKISDSENARIDEIKKKEMVMLYLNYGYYYVQSQGYTNEQTFTLILDNLINNKIMIQTALIHFGAETTGKWEAADYLDSDEMVKATYNTIKYMNDFIDNYEVSDSDKKYDEFSGDTRAVPTGATNADEKLSSYDMKAYNAKYEKYGADVGQVGSNRYKAYNKVLKILEDNGLLGEDAKTLKDSDYFKDTLKSNQESLLVEKYEKDIKAAARDAITFDKLKDAYTEMYNAQRDKIVDVAAFESALSSASATSPVVYTPYTGYIYVYNLLLGANDYQTTLINKLDSKEAGYYNDLKDILSTTVIKDQRSSWIHAGYDFDLATLKFTGDYAFLSDSIPFQGAVELVNDAAKVAAKEEDAKYRIKSVIEYNLEDFIEFINDYVYGENEIIDYQTNEPYVYKAVDSSADIADYDERINELLFAFSTDSGSLNTYKGYLVSPKPDIGGSETYVKEFANAGRLFLTENLGNKSYVIVATQYGYHVMFFSQKLGADSNFDNLVDYLNYATGKNLTEDGWKEELSTLKVKWDDDDTDTKAYLYNIVNVLSNADAVLSEKQTSIINKYKGDENYVVKYTSNYQDLLELE